MKGKFKNRLLTLMFLALFCSFSIPSSRASSFWFEQYAYEQCYYTITYRHYNLYTRCDNGAFIRLEYVGDNEVTTQSSRQYCNGGWGWCQSSDSPCQTSHTETVIDNTYCE